MRLNFWLEPPLSRNYNCAKIVFIVESFFF